MGNTQKFAIVRIIPARAGFTWYDRRTDRHRTDHPRSRGVYGSVEAGLRLKLGSSPLARGLPRVRHLQRANTRIIPARAGFTDGRGRDAHGDLGSSPLARGLLMNKTAPL